MKLVIVESPFAGELGLDLDGDDVENNLRYARAAMRDSISRGEAPFASHVLYTQPGVLCDRVPDERQLGIDAGMAWGRVAHATVVYTDLGISPGMRQGITCAQENHRPVEYRTLDGWPPLLPPRTIQIVFPDRDCAELMITEGDRTYRKIPLSFQQLRLINWQLAKGLWHWPIAAKPSS